MHDFHEYYSGARTAPYLTVFVGGNHEASNYLFELYYGGWVAPNIYYLGAASVLRLGPLRIAGVSGIWKGFDYRKPHHERIPYNEDDIKSIYHVRELDVRKLLQIRTQVDVGISHDWPKGVEWRGNWKRLFRQKAHLEADAREGKLGSVAAQHVMDRLRPPYWFSAHLHCKYAAVVEHEKDVPPQEPLPSANSMPVTDGRGANGTAEKVAKNTDEIDLDMDDEDTKPEPQTLPVNGDEIDLELEEDDETTATATVASGQGLDGVKVPVDGEGEANGPLNVQAPATEQSIVPEDIRAQLPAAFSQPKPTSSHQPTNQPISHPPEIDNKVTQFLALDKCMPNRDFLQLLSITPSKPSTVPITRPLQLEYDREWLAITRVFASDLVVGDPNAKVPQDQGEAHYKPLIEAEEAWIEENLVRKGRMAVPQNFEITAPVYDHNMGIHVGGVPEEYTNNQTVAFCEMLQIPNPFDISAEERVQRVVAGPRAEEPRWNGGGRDGGFRGRGRGGGFGGGRGGHRGRGGGGRGRGRGRGRGWA